MRLVVTALMALLLLLAVGCDENDKNTVNSIPKYHTSYPIFRLQIDNGYKIIGVDSVELTVSPDIGWRAPVYTDIRGFIGTLASGSYILDIDTTIIDADTTIDTTSEVVGFTPAQEYTFGFQRAQNFAWNDSLRLNYVTTIDSLWMTLDADTLRVRRTIDPANPPVMHLDSIKNIDMGYSPLNPPDSTYDQEFLIGEWFDTAFVITNPDDTIGFPPDTVYFDTITWGFWNTVDTFYLAIDSAALCDEEIEIIRTNVSNNPAFPLWVVDTVVNYVNCQPAIDSVWTKVYRTRGWGEYDTTFHYAYPDSAKELIFSNGQLSVRNTVSDETRAATIYFIQNGTTTTITDLNLILTIPALEIFPEYEIIVKEE